MYTTSVEKPSFTKIAKDQVTHLIKFKVDYIASHKIYGYVKGPVKDGFINYNTLTNDKTIFIIILCILAIILIYIYIK